MQQALVHDQRLLPITSHILACAGEERERQKAGTGGDRLCICCLPITCIHTHSQPHSTTLTSTHTNLTGSFTATDAYDHMADLARLRAAATVELRKADCLLVPTALAHYTVQVGVVCWRKKGSCA